MPPERRAVLLLLGLAALGQGVRAWWAAPGRPPGEGLVLPGAGAPLAHRDSALALARPLAPGETIDLDRATAEEIARLPRVGLSLARTIASDRAARGPFGSLAALDRVPGVGPGMLAAIGGQVRFSAPRRQDATSPRSTDSTIGSPAPHPPAAVSIWRPGDVPLDLNHATAAELEGLPYVGPAMARAIVAFREAHGPFPAVDSLIRVPGVGPGVLAKLRGRVRVE